MRQPPTAVRSAPSLSSSAQSEGEAGGTQIRRTISGCVGCQARKPAWLRFARCAAACALDANRLSHGEAGVREDLHFTLTAMQSPMERLESAAMTAKCADVCVLNQAASIFGESDSQDDVRFTAKP